MRKNSKYTNSDDKNEKYYVHLSAILVLKFCFQGKILDDMYIFFDRLGSVLHRLLKLSPTATKCF